jgi:hypothetical protein
MFVPWLFVKWQVLQAAGIYKEASELRAKLVEKSNKEIQM